ncbi:flagellar basal body rod protein FlgC [Paraburkholderia terricola]|uniref:Flagellar basal-body rod protein FlgC n=1 Tax=Paraburkholderia terricola TaxID=169427 RepID=A0ABU1LX34_9BURK|nr:flagellar basal body rod protein FlgC [Paraburkholderia terricola]MDR6411309.1 flagellar basal-body rod protein FlgC [Paraburkholderia terricola]MDR6483451.1 flagellar basal-body rod protein FlgC [Paraburkholderia terricola]
MSDSIFAIARSGLDVERQRMEVIARNLANAGTTRTASGAPYQPLRLVSGPRIASPFAAELNGTGAAGAGGIGGIGASDVAALAGVQAYGIESIDVPARLVHDPSHPHADARGFVAYPGLDHASEMALMVQTLRVYEADVVMFNAARSMYMRALELGSRA